MQSLYAWRRPGEGEGEGEGGGGGGTTACTTYRHYISIMGSAGVWKPVLLLGLCLMLLAATVVTHLLWRMSSVSLFHGTLFVPVDMYTQLLTMAATPESVNDEDGDGGRPELVWEEVAEAPVARLDGAAVQIGQLFYVFAGYASIDEVHSHVDVYNLSSNTWESSFAMPAAMAHSHLGMATDGRFIYIVSGQVGSQCRGPTARNFVLDTQTRSWSELLPLPSPRYAPATQLWRGRLHVMGGSKEDRQQPAHEHWSIPVRNGKVLESEWSDEIPIPRGGPHRACVVVEDDLYVIGGQEGDFKAKPGSLNFKCSRKKEVVYSDVHKLAKRARRWRQLPPMLKPISHIEFAWVTFNRSIVIIGGSTMNNPLTKKMVLLGDIFHFDTQTKVWRKLGQMPYRGKTVLAAYWEGWLYFTAGQRDKGPSDPTPRKIMAKTWRTKLVI
ncbi:hypothetical protein KC19_1G335900 [Ceratodon purpureus]|uniref:Kelch repeat-containing protein n=1 Tax=Ceratodon purpureus TaxID=3225 RepID=A0A8T0JEI5_CERPU|nr:hypothetical protein KC19_1G335900 [Ceratodon purpureus]